MIINYNLYKINKLEVSVIMEVMGLQTNKIIIIMDKIIIITSNKKMIFMN